MPVMSPWQIPASVASRMGRSNVIDDTEEDPSSSGIVYMMPPQASRGGVSMAPQALSMDPSGRVFAPPAMAGLMATDKIASSQAAPSQADVLAGLQKNMASKTSQETHQGIKTIPLLYSDADLQNVRDRSEQDPAYQKLAQDRSSLATLMAQMSEAQQPRQDLTGLGNFAAYASGSRPQYTPPPTPEATMARQLQEAQVMPNLDATMLDKLNALAGMQKAGQVQDLYKTVQGASEGTKPLPQRVPVDVQVNDKALKEIGKDSFLKEAPDFIKDLRDVKGMLATADNPVMMQNIRFKLLGLMGTGKRMTNMELSGEQGSKALADQLNQKLETLLKSELTPANKAAYMDLVNQLEGTFSGIYSRRRNFQMNKVQKLYGVSPENANAMIDNINMGPDGLKPAAPPAGGGAGPQGIDDYFKKGK